MIDTKLIMVEGIVGSGKSTTADHIAKLISDAGKKVNLYHEYAREYPLEMYISNLLQNNYGKQFDVQSVVRKILANDTEVDSLPHWKDISEFCLSRDEVTIIESRFWQHETMIMYLCGIDSDRILKRQQEIFEVLADNNPFLVCLANDNVVPIIEKAFAERREIWRDWITWMFAEFPYFTSRNLSGKDGMIEFYKDWNQLAEALFNQYPGAKVAMRNPHNDWQTAYKTLEGALAL
ncbi:MAG: hypothetical protein ACK2TS_05550 [Anaerolineales bacterium]